MDAEELRLWVEGQIKVLVSCGVSPLDAENTMKRVLAKLPEGQDPRTWIPLVEGGNVEITEADIDDSRAAWYATVDPKYARLLDAKEED